MNNWIKRNGFHTKKVGSESSMSMLISGRIGRPREHRSPESHTPNGSLIIHRGDDNPFPGSCESFIHPCKGSKVEYRDEDGYSLYHTEVLLSDLAASAESCGFCSILDRGIRMERPYWITEWAKRRWLDIHPEFDLNLAGSDAEQEWMVYFRDEIINRKPIDETKVILDIAFPKGHKYVNVKIMLAPDDDSESSRRQTLVDLEFYTAP
ncbi:hypothetical protein F5882DRAFT_446650, partial [Hyaloscypha sp. PMI_1271]